MLFRSLGVLAQVSGKPTLEELATGASQLGFVNATARTNFAKLFL